jgi:7-cyano-7-deazaguanine synthase
MTILKKDNLPKAVVICSGGMDSVTLAYETWVTHSVYLLSFDYGQRHKKELLYAKIAAQDLGCYQRTVDLSALRSLLGGSSLTDVSVGVPEGHYSAESMKQTIVPNRNAIMLTVAFGYAATIGAESVWIAVHAGDHAIYPDCRPDFMSAFRRMQYEAFRNMWNVHLETPFIHQTKADIAHRGATLGVPFEKTWSCYKGDERHCGRCGTCVERQEAFALAGVVDRTEYEDSTFWKTQVQTHGA